MKPPTVFAAPSASESVFWLTIVVLSAVSAARVGPGPSSLLGTGIQALLWTCLYIGLAESYGASARESGQETRRVLRRLAASLLLAVLATYSARLVLSHLAPSLWSPSFYLRFLLPSVFAANPSQRHHHLFPSDVDPGDRGASSE